MGATWQNLIIESDLMRKVTSYFTTSVIPRRPYLKMEWIEGVLRNPIHTEVQANGRVRHWGYIPELGKYLRVVTEPDGETVHNAFADRRFRPKEV
jgi:hypothetical protein